MRNVFIAPNIYSNSTKHFMINFLIYKNSVSFNQKVFVVVCVSLLLKVSDIFICRTLRLCKEMQREEESWSLNFENSYDKPMIYRHILHQYYDMAFLQIPHSALPEKNSKDPPNSFV